MFGQEESEGPRRLALDAMPFPDRLATLRKERGLTQQALADRAGLHVSMIRKYETRAGQPTLDAIRRLAVALTVPSDLLVFDTDERGPDDDLRLPFEAASQLDPDSKRLVKELIEGLVLKREVRRWADQGGRVASSAN